MGHKTKTVYPTGLKECTKTCQCNKCKKEKAAEKYKKETEEFCAYTDVNL